MFSEGKWLSSPQELHCMTLAVISFQTYFLSIFVFYDVIVKFGLDECQLWLLFL